MVRTKSTTLPKRSNFNTIFFVSNQNPTTRLILMENRALPHTSANMIFFSVCLLIASIASIHGTCGLQLSMVASRAPSRTKSLGRKIPFSSSRNSTRSSSVTSTLISQLACMALKRRLEDHTHVSCDLTADSNNLFLGRVGPVTVKGRGWRSPLGLTCKAIEATVNECRLDMGRVISNQKLVLTIPGAS